jgi:hypothetical protein
MAIWCLCSHEVVQSSNRVWAAVSWRILADGIVQRAV